MCLAVPGQIETIDESAPLLTGTVSFGGARREVCLAYVPEAGVGDWVMVHVGFAISVIDEDEARRLFDLLDEADL